MPSSHQHHPAIALQFLCTSHVGVSLHVLPTPHGSTWPPVATSFLISCALPTGVSPLLNSLPRFVFDTRAPLLHPVLLVFDVISTGLLLVPSISPLLPFLTTTWHAPFSAHGFVTQGDTVAALFCHYESTTHMIEQYRRWPSGGGRGSYS
jgi:hypothetical protein